jgi:predicted transcriptional regulator
MGRDPERSRARVLGALERAVLDALWSAGASDVKAMHRAVGTARGIAPNTIQSTLERLVRKGLAERRKVGRAFEYAPRLSRREWLAAELEALLVDAKGPARLLLAAFVDLTERAGAERLSELEALVRERRRERSGPREDS